MTDFVTVEGRTLAAALKIVNAALLKRKHSIPVLNAVRLHLDAGRIWLHATDLDMEIVADVDPIDHAGHFDMCLPGRLLARIANVGPDVVRIEPENATVARITIGSGDATYELPAYPPGDFPHISKPVKWAAIETFTNGRLATLLDKVAGCISTEETRYYLNGAAWQSDHEGKRFIATDGHRLAMASYYKAGHGDAVSSDIIPHATINALRSITKGKDVQAFRGEGNLLRFVMDHVAITTKTIDGTFPDWRRVVPKAEDRPYRLEFSTDRLRDALDRVIMMAGRDDRVVRIFRAFDGTAHLSIKSTDNGEGTAKTFATWPIVGTAVLPEEKLPGGGWVSQRSRISFGFNARYLKAAIGKSATLTFAFSDSNGPFRIDDGDEEMTRLLMPMRVA